MAKVRMMLFTAMLALGACGEDEKRAKDDGTCDPEAADACDDGLLCEQLGADRHECLPPVIVSGRVFDAIDATGLAGATIVGIDANGAARTRVARSAEDGRYELPVSVRRNEDGSPVEDAITLRVAAADHQAFPTAPRAALPVELAQAVTEGDEEPKDEEVRSASYRVENAATDVALIPLADADRGGATVSGHIAAEAAGGVLVLAVSGDRAKSSAVSDLDGTFVLFNVPAGEIRLEGYRAGLAVEPQTLSVSGAGADDVALAVSEASLSTVSGSVSIVNADGGLKTTVILVVASTFDPAAVRGEAPAGLRAVDVSGGFDIKDVPKGRYAVLAAFENDLLVRDPDEGISGTDVVFVDVGGSTATKSLDQGFKVTQGLEVVSPGANGVERVAVGDVALRWKDDSSEDGYELRVYNALGELVHEDLAVPRVTGSDEVSYSLDATNYETGMIYQFRVLSFRDKGGRSFISATEDLKGVFEIAR